MMMTAGYFRQIPDLPKIFWRYPISYINYGAWGLQVNLEAPPFSNKERKPKLSAYNQKDINCQLNGL